MSIPIVIPLHPAGGKFRDNTELRYALRSLEKHLSPLPPIVIAGKNMPSWLKGVTHLKVGGLKAALRLAAETYPDGFHWWYDDSVLLRGSTPDQLKVTPCCKTFRNTNTAWGKGVTRMQRALEEEGIKAWDYSHPHGPYFFDREMVDDAIARFTRPGKRISAKLPIETYMLSKRDWPRVHGEHTSAGKGFNGVIAPEKRYLNYHGMPARLLQFLEERFPDPSSFEVMPEEIQETAVTPLCFIHVPKAAGTSIRSALGFKMMARGSSHFPSTHPKVIRMKNRSGALVFGVVRNPYDRAYSIWKFFHRKKEGKTPRIDSIVRSLVAGMTLDDFWLRADIGLLQQHIEHVKPQSHFLKTTDRVLRYESLDEDWEKLMRETGRNGQRLPHIQKSPGKPWQEAMSDEVKARVREIYAEDFRNFYQQEA